MTHLITRTALVAAAATLLTACATTPQYPTAEGQTGGGPGLQAPRPAYPIQSPGGEPDPAPEAAPSTPVESTPLPPVASTPRVESSTLPPPTMRGPEPEVVEPPYSPPPAPVMRPVTKTVTLAPGKVIDVDGRPKTYTVKEGQGLDAVARAMGSTRVELAKINGLKEPYALKPGQVIKGPASRAKAYVVASGDTLFAIARRFGVTAKALAEENDIETGSSLRVGQKIKLPDGYKDAGPTKKTVTTMEPDPSARPVQPTRPPYPQPRPYPQPQPVTPPTPEPVRPPVVTQPVTPPPTTTRPATRPPVVTTPPPAATRPPVVKPPVVTPPVTPPVATPTRPTPLPPVVATRPTPTPSTGSIRLDPDCWTRSTGLAGGGSGGPSSDRALPDGAAPVLSDAQIAALGRGCFIWPAKGQVLSGFGPKGAGKRNDGLDIGAVAGSPVLAASSGKVVYSGGDVPGFGVTVLIQHENGWVTVYGNLGKAEVRMQQSVVAGQQIGTVGMSGGALQPQLHFEVRYSPSPKFKAKAIDPALVLPR